MPWDASPEAFAQFAPRGIILSGGPESVAEQGSPQISDALLAAGAPVLGICYGMQALAAKLGGAVASADNREYGYAEVDLTGSDPLLAKLGARLKVWMSHGDRVERLPKGFAAIGSSSNSPFAAMADVERKIYALQFHPEVTHTEHGLTINDYEVLLHLSRADERRLRRVDLAERVILTASGITRLLEGLEHGGYVERDSCPSDRRVVYAKLTDVGLDKLREASRTHLAGVDELFVQRYNADATPFQWVATADSILQKIERIAKRISATGH